MAETANLNLPLVQPAQAQKHVTVNEALARLDGLSQTVLLSVTQPMPPASVVEGTTYGVPIDAVDAWEGQDGKVAIFVNGGWVFQTPRAGWRAYVADQNQQALHDGTGWQVGAVAVSAQGAASLIEVVEFDQDVASLVGGETAVVIPSHSILLGVSGIVVSALSGSATSWQIGVPGSPNRYGSGLGLAADAWLLGMSGQPQTYYSPTPLVISGEGGDLTGGTIRLALHLYRITLPRA